ncbi:MAG: DEAD/DEAH box helicase [Sporomusaceae bacterium]|nr:DEAD/DEAH box helicase [Sporomusaceae bacterium]
MEYLCRQFDGKVFLHQATAITKALGGENVVISTGTASGKTLCFALPVFHFLMQDPNAKAMFFYPTKALAGDQLQSLSDVAKALGLGKIVYRFDGDVQDAERREALRKGRVFICTPDVLHATILRRNEDAEYHALLANLALIVLDECHVYSGAFGSNMAFVIRRLRQVCKRKGCDPRFLAASATSRDPGKHLEMLVGKPFLVIDESLNGSPHSGRQYLMVKTQSEDDDDSIYQFFSELVNGGKRFIAFCHSRRMAELFYHRLVERFPQLKQKVMPYRSGYEPGDRRLIEEALREGALTGVISTSALELGIDLPGLEYCLHLGLPSTAMSFWQRSGRVGRQQGVQGKVVIVPSGNAIDDYYHNHPERLYDRPLEELVLHLDNRFLLLSHFACARIESGDFENPNLDSDIFGHDFVNLCDKIDEMDVVDDVLISPEPHRILNIRCIDDPTYEIPSGGRLLGTITFSQLLREAYEGAVYRHMGEAYRVQRVRHREQIVEVKPETPSAQTSPVGFIQVKERSGPGSIVFRRTLWQNFLEMAHTSMVAVTNITGYREKIGGGWVAKKYPRPLQRRVYSEGVMIRLHPSFGHVPPDGLNALAHALSTVYAISKPCDSAEIATHSVIRKQDNSAVIYIFDTTSGGLGISTAVYDNFRMLLPMAKELLTTCAHCDPETFDKGCPSCIQVPRWYADNDRLSKNEALIVLERINEIISTQTSKEDISQTYRYRIDGGYTSIQDPADDNEIEVKFGKMLFMPGCQVKLPSGLTGRVNAVDRSTGECRYELALENGRIVPVRDMGLSLINGDVEYICLNCGTELETREPLCPNCGCDLF